MGVYIKPKVKITQITVYSDSAKNITHPEIDPNDINITNRNVHISIEKIEDQVCQNIK
jgi:hypothetical protein